ncbi:hypothetical protein [Methanosarcina sp. KYL-1]|nr:hypothetical protein [Methanosarcina sp. KYL-1]
MDSYLPFFAGREQNFVGKPEGREFDNSCRENFTGTLKRNLKKYIN